MAQLKKFSYVAFFLIGLIILTSCTKSNQTSPSSQSANQLQSQVRVVIRQLLQKIRQKN